MQLSKPKHQTAERVKLVTSTSQTHLLRLVQNKKTAERTPISTSTSAHAIP